MTTLYLMHCQPDPRLLTVWAARHGLYSQQGDLGYALHALLHAAFGDAAPKPFSYQGENGGLLAYSPLPAAELRERYALAAPDAAAALGLDPSLSSTGLSVRPYPQQWRAGAVLGFEVRIRPVLRQQGRERDVFLCAVENSKTDGAQDAAPPQREVVYKRWLADQLEATGAAQLLDASLTRFQLTDVVRRTQAGDGIERKQRQVSGPDAVFSGHLQIQDPAAFTGLLVRGLGRHRAFGFGMLLLRPAKRLD